MMSRFRVWDPDNGERPESTNVAAMSISEAATQYVEGNWANMSGAQFRYVVTASQDVSFSATPQTPDVVDVEQAIREISDLPVHAADGVAYVNRQSVYHLLRCMGRGH